MSKMGTDERTDGKLNSRSRILCEFCIFWRALATWNWHRKGLLRHIKNQPLHNEVKSILIPTGLYCFQRLLDILQHLFASTFGSSPYQALTYKPKNKSISQQWQNFHFYPSRLLLFTRSAKNWSRQTQPLPGSQVIENRLLVWKLQTKNFPKDPHHSSNPLQAPPARCVHLLSAPLLACRMAKGGGPPLLYPLIPSPPPILHSINSHPSHLIPSVHQNCPLKVFNVHPFCHLSVQAACVYTSHFHDKIHILTTIVMMDTPHICHNHHNRWLWNFF